MNVRIRSDRFTYHRPTQTFVADMSDLQVNIPDCITIVSTKTGYTVDFFFAGEIRNNEDTDGELTGYFYNSLFGYKIHLYND